MLDLQLVEMAGETEEVWPCWRKHANRVAFRVYGPAPLPACSVCFVLAVQGVSSQHLVPAIVPAAYQHASPPSWALSNLEL